MSSLDHTYFCGVLVGLGVVFNESMASLSAVHTIARPPWISGGDGHTLQVVTHSRWSHTPGGHTLQRMYVHACMSV